MNVEQVKKAIEESLKKVAPEVNFSEIDFNTPFRTQVDIDSYDLYNIFAKVESQTNVRIPEAKLREITTLSGLVNFIVSQSELSV